MAGALKLNVCEAYTAPGKREPMMAGKRDAMRMPGSEGLDGVGLTPGDVENNEGKEESDS